MKDTVFISHATPADNTFAAWLATKLELCGYNVWVDINNLSPSVDFWNKIGDILTAIPEVNWAAKPFKYYI